MKKTWVITLSVIFIFIISLLNVSSDVGEMIYTYSNSYAIVVRSESFDEYKNCNFIDMSYCRQVYLNEYKKYKTELIGEYYEIFDLEKANLLVKKINAIVISSQHISNLFIVYAYSNNIKYKAINGANIEYVFTKNKCIIGVPIIFSEM